MMTGPWPAFQGPGTPQNRPWHNRERVFIVPWAVSGGCGTTRRAALTLLLLETMTHWGTMGVKKVTGHLDPHLQTVQRRMCFVICSFPVA